MMAAASFFEAAMLLCFGLAWPLGCARMLCARRAEGRGLLCTGIVLAGYLAGDVAKFLASPAGTIDPVFWLYLLNTLSVGFNLLLQWHFGRTPPPQVRLQPLGAAAASIRR